MRRINIPYLFDPTDRRGVYLDLRANKFEFTNKTAPISNYPQANNVGLALIEDMGPNARDASITDSSDLTSGVIIKQETLAKQPTYRNGMLFFDNVDDALEIYDLTVKRDAAGREIPNDSGLVGDEEVELYFQMGVFHGGLNSAARQFDPNNPSANISQLKGRLLVPASREYDNTGTYISSVPFEFIPTSSWSPNNITALILSEKPISTSIGNVVSVGHILGNPINTISEAGGLGNSFAGYDAWADSEFSNVRAFAHWFRNNDYVTEIDGSNWDTANSDNWLYAFFRTSNLRHIWGAENWNMSLTTDLSGFSYENYNLESINVSTWNTSNVTRMPTVFYRNLVLKDIDVSNWDTTKVTTIGNMFTQNYLIPTLNVSNWNTSNITDAVNFAYYVNNISELDVSSWDTSKIKSIHAFIGHTNFPLLDISKWDLSNVESLRRFAINASKLTSLGGNVVNTFSTLTQTNNLTSAFQSTNLDSISIDGIVHGLNLANNKNGRLDITGGANNATAQGNVHSWDLMYKNWAIRDKFGPFPIVTSGEYANAEIRIDPAVFFNGTLGATPGAKAGFWANSFSPLTGRIFTNSAGSTPATQWDENVGHITGFAGTVNALLSGAGKGVTARWPVGGRRNLLTWTEDLSKWIMNDATNIGPIDGYNVFETGDSQALGRQAVQSPNSVSIEHITSYSIIIDKNRSNDRPTSFVSSSWGSSPKIGAEVNTGVRTWASLGATEDIFTNENIIHDPYTNFRLIVRNPTSNPAGAVYYFRAPQVEEGPICTPYQRVTTANDVTEEGLPDVWHIYGGSLKTESLPAGTYGRAWVDVLGNVGFDEVELASAGTIELLVAERQADVYLLEDRFTEEQKLWLTLYWWRKYRKDWQYDEKLYRLFSQGRRGFWANGFHPDRGFLFQNPNGTLPVTHTGNTVGQIATSVRNSPSAISMMPAIQDTLAARPQFQQANVAGQLTSYLQFDKVDDNMTINFANVTSGDMTTSFEATLIQGMREGIFKAKVNVANSIWSFTTNPAYFPSDNIVDIFLIEGELEDWAEERVRLLMAQKGAGSL